jgi:hypothetical protein
MEGSVLSFLRSEWKVSDTGSAHWASSLTFHAFIIFCLAYDENRWKCDIGIVFLVAAMA